MMRSAAVALCSALLLAGCGQAPATKGEGTKGEGNAAPATAAGSGSAAVAQPQDAASGAAVADKAEAARLAHDRHERFEAIGKAFKTINDQLKSAKPDTARVSGAAAKINGYAPQIPTWFPAGTGKQDGIKTHALAEIWREPAAFRKAAGTMAAAAAALNAAAPSGDAERTRAAAQALGKTCKGCHDRFREEDD